MKKLLLSLVVLFTVGFANAYNIGGAFAQLQKCSWGQFGYQYGYIGTYLANGQVYQVFFGNQFCKQ